MLRTIINKSVGAIQLIFILPFVIIARLINRKPKAKPRLFWGTTTIVSLPMNAKALHNRGFFSKAIGLKSRQLKVPDGFNFVLEASGSSHVLLRWAGGNIGALVLFICSPFQYDIFHCFFNGVLLNRTALRNFEPKLLRLAGKEVIVFPYGSDAFAPSRIPYLRWRGALLSDYPILGARDWDIANRIDQYCRDASFVVGSLVHLVTLPRWDSLMLTCYPIDVDMYEPVFPTNRENSLRVFHAPNHRGVKGTAHLIAAVEKLQSEGLPIELDLVERQPHKEVIKRMRKANLVVDQLHFGYALTAMEGMALGKMVISGKNPAEHDQLFDQLGLKDCPIIWASVETIEAELRSLLVNPDQWRQIGQNSRKFVEHYHSYDATADNWIALYKKLGYRSDT